MSDTYQTPGKAAAYNDSASTDYVLPSKPTERLADAPIRVEPVKKSDLQASYAQVMATPDNGWYGSLIDSIGGCVGALGTIPCCICFPNPFKSVEQGKVGLVTKFGQFYKSVDPGLVKVNPLSEKLRKVDVTLNVLDIPMQRCMSKDNVTIDLSSVMYYHVTSPHKAVFSVQNVTYALQERTQTTLRHVVGARNLQDIIERREELAEAIQEIIDDSVKSWGVKVESILIKDYRLSPELESSLALVAKTKRASESKILTAKAEVESAKLMRKAADILASKAAMQIRYLEAMQNMAKTSGSHVIFMPSQGAIEGMSSDAARKSAPGGIDPIAEEATGSGNSEQDRIAQMIAYNEAVMGPRAGSAGAANTLEPGEFDHIHNEVNFA